MDEVECSNSNNNILMCDHNELGVDDCDHSEDAGVICRNGEYKRHLTCLVISIIAFGCLPENNHTILNLIMVTVHGIHT